MPDTGWVNAGLGASVIKGATTWLTPTQVYTSNNSYADAHMASEGTSYWLRTTSYGFAIPGGSTIVGIEARFEKRAQTASTIKDWDVKLVKAGTEQGDDEDNSAWWTTSDTYVVHGGPAMLWGLAWTPADINAGNFGVSISARNFDVVQPRYALVDHVQIKVYYTEPAVTMEVNVAGAWKDVDEVKVNVSGAWKAVTEVWINVSGVWKQVF